MSIISTAWRQTGVGLARVLVAFPFWEKPCLLTREALPAHPQDNGSSSRHGTARHIRRTTDAPRARPQAHSYTFPCSTGRASAQNMLQRPKKKRERGAQPASPRPFHSVHFALLTNARMPATEDLHAPFFLFTGPGNAGRVRRFLRCKAPVYPCRPSFFLFPSALPSAFPAVTVPWVVSLLRRCLCGCTYSVGIRRGDARFSSITCVDWYYSKISGDYSVCVVIYRAGAGAYCKNMLGMGILSVRCCKSFNISHHHACSLGIRPGETARSCAFWMICRGLVVARCLSPPLRDTTALTPCGLKEHPQACKYEQHGIRVRTNKHRVPCGYEQHGIRAGVSHVPRGHAAPRLGPRNLNRQQSGPPPCAFCAPGTPDIGSGMCVCLCFCWTRPVLLLY